MKIPVIGTEVPSLLAAPGGCMRVLVKGGGNDNAGRGSPSSAANPASQGAKAVQEAGREK
jgi:hypothetical protein